MSGGHLFESEEEDTDLDEEVVKPLDLIGSTYISASDIMKKYGLCMSKNLGSTTAEQERCVVPVGQVKYLAEKLGPCFSVVYYFVCGAGSKMTTWHWESNVHRMDTLIYKMSIGGELWQWKVRRSEGSLKLSNQDMFIRVFSNIAANWEYEEGIIAPISKDALQFIDAIHRQLAFCLKGENDEILNSILFQLNTKVLKLQTKIDVLLEQTKDMQLFFLRQIDLLPLLDECGGVDQVSRLEPVLDEILQKTGLTPSTWTKLSKELIVLRSIRTRREVAIRDYETYTSVKGWETQLVGVMDFEMYVHNPALMLECGLTVMTRDGTKVLQSEHWIVAENAHFRNSELGDVRSKFHYGTTSFVAQSELLKVIKGFDSTLSCWLFHDRGSDLNYLSLVGIHLSKYAYDTQVFCDVFPWVSGRQFSLSNLVLRLSLDHRDPHNAGNDAYVTSRVLYKELTYYLTYCKKPKQVSLATQVVKSPALSQSSICRNCKSEVTQFSGVKMNVLTSEQLCLKCMKGLGKLDIPQKRSNLRKQTKYKRMSEVVSTGVLEFVPPVPASDFESDSLEWANE
jgi:hypothetical protein